MAELAAELRVVWAPSGGVSTAESWWPPGPPPVAPPVAGLDAGARFGGGAIMSPRADGVEAAWRGAEWQPALRERPLTVAVVPGQLRVSVPETWRAHAYMGWREGRLLLSSDLRVLAAALAEARPAPAGVAAFVAGGRSTLGLTPSLYHGIQEIQPGHEVVVDADGETRCRRSWTPELEPRFAALPREEATRRLRTHLDELAGRILGRHDRVACLFSGGLDSTLVAATLLRLAPQRVTLFNVGSGLGTSAEEDLRARFLGAAGAVSHEVDLGSDAGLVRSLRATNAVAALPTASLFAHVFEEIIAAAHGHGCDAIVTGDGGDEAFAEREELLVDLLAGRSRTLPAAAGSFTLRNGERCTEGLRRAWTTLRALRDGSVPAHFGRPEELAGEELASLVFAARGEVTARAAELWHTGWTWSGIGSYRRTAEVPEWEPVSAQRPGFAVLSPLADATVLGDALDLRRDAVVADVLGGQPKWLLRQAALEWLSPDIALHPKIGSADGQILTRMRAHELPDLLDLFSSTTAHRAGFTVPARLEAASAPLWHGEAWLRAAAVIAWFDKTTPAVRARPTITAVSTRGATQAGTPAARQRSPARPGWPQVAGLVALNLVARLAPAARPSDGAPVHAGTPRSASDDELSRTMFDLARRACAVPFVSASPPVMVRAVAWYLRLAGRRPVVTWGVAQGRSTTHCWIEVEDSVVDVGCTEVPLVPG